MRKAGRRSRHGGSEKPRILIADDEQSMREWMRLLFQRDGFEVLIGRGRHRGARPDRRANTSTWC